MGKIALGCALLAGATAMTALACSLVPPPTGLLGNGTFTYVCPAPSASVVDPGCPTPNGLPENPVAVGASFSVTYTPLSQNGTSSVEGPSFYTVAPASPLLLSSNDGALVATGPGYEALLASSGRVVDDFVFIRLETIDRLVPSASSIALGAADGPQTLSVQPEDGAGNILAGQLACSWSVTAGSNLIALDAPTASSSVQIQGMADGTATVQAACGAASVDVTVNVSGFGSSAGDGGTDGSTDGGSRG
jgi:hypothetical protein